MRNAEWSGWNGKCPGWSENQTLSSFVTEAALSHGVKLREEEKEEEEEEWVLQNWSGNLYEPPEQSGCWWEWKKRGNVGDGRAASWHRSALCAAARTYANVSYANEAPPRPSVVKGRHSITQSRSGGELASLHLSGSDGPSSGYQGDVRWIKEALRGGIKPPLILRPPRWRGERLPGTWPPLNALL